MNAATVAARRPAGPKVRVMLTPEGVELSLVLADGGQRVTAFLLDVVGMVLLLVVLTILAVAVGLSGGGGVGIALWVAGFFLLRNFYFAYFELTPRAATPGKRMLGMRVAARDGGRLTGNAILARNLVRELELFLPLTALAVEGTNAGGWLVMLGLGWTGIFLVFPLLNRDRLRVGDLLAGTWVVLEPRPRLLPDLLPGLLPDLLPDILPGPAAGQRADATGKPRSALPPFTRAQRTAYGVRELHVLEDVLRQNDATAMDVVADKIMERIGWTRGSESNAVFLAAYYAALREELERGLLFGKRKTDKNDRT